MHLARGDPTKISEVKWSLTSSQALQVANYHARHELVRQRDMLSDKALHASLAGVKRNPFAQEIAKLDRRIQVLQVGVQKAAEKLPDLDQRIVAFARASGMQIEKVKAKPKRGAMSANGRIRSI